MPKMKKLILLAGSMLALSSCDMIVPGGLRPSASTEEATTEQSGSNTKPSSNTGSNTSGNTSTSTGPVIHDKGKTTVLMYICGADLESDSGQASGNLNEILSVSNQPSDVNIVVMTGGAKKWKMTNPTISASALSIYHVENRQLVLDKTLTYASMGASSTLQTFVEYGLTYYPAEKTGVIMWNHGGAMQGCCYDEKKNDDSLTAAEVGSAFKGAFSKLNRTEKLEWIGYDCCLMAVQDIASVNSQYFNYMISSQESEPGPGWDYDGWVDNLYATPLDTVNVLKAVCDTYYDKVGEYYNDAADEYNEPSYRGYNDTTLSILDLSKMSAYVDAWENMVSSNSSKFGSSSAFNSLVNTMSANSVKKFGYDEDYGYTFDVYDADDYLNKLGISVSTVTSKLSDLVIYNKVGKDHSGACGLSVFMASNYDDVQGGTTKQEYTASDTLFTTWRNKQISYATFYSAY